MSGNPCPHRSRCGFASEDCTEELANTTCDVIRNTTPPPPKEWRPQEPVAVTLTREEWQGVVGWIQLCADWNACRMLWWRDCCNDKKMGAETAARYEASMKNAERLCKIIEEATV